MTPTQDGPTLMLTYEQVAKELQVSGRTIERMVAAGTLCAIRVTPRVLRIRRTDLERYVKRLRTTEQIGAELCQ